MNVLFITADQWRGECLGVLGHACVKTPNLDGLAAEGVVFRRHYTQASPCGPARASLLTGLYMFNHRSVRNGAPLDARHTNIAREVRKAGYDPVLFGYTDTTLDPRTLPAGDPRLSTYEGVLPGMTPVLVLPSDPKPWLRHLRGRGYPEPLSLETVYAPVEGYPGADGRGTSYPPPVFRAEDSETAFLADEALGWLKMHEDRAWFLHLSFLRPHEPWIAPEPYNAMYDLDAVPPDHRAATHDEEGAQHPFLAWLIGGTRMERFLPRGNGSPANLSEVERRQIRATYYGLVTEVDHHIGRLIDYLKASGQYDNTLVVFTSDHGEHLGDHYLYGKSGYFDEAFYVPLIVRDPSPEADTARGRAIDEFTEIVDVMPTILDRLGLEIPVECDGRSLMPFLRGERPARWRQEVYWELDFRDVRTFEFERLHGLKPDQCSLSVVRDREYKYVHFTAMEPLFFDLRADPHEFHNRARDPAQSGRVLEYAQRMLSWRMNHADRVLANMQAGEGGIREWRGARS
ncbi:MAG: alkaline phosphatase family protein [Alphaproteobacteria bacterium]